MLPLLTVDQALQAQRGHLLPWVPVCLSFGIGSYFLMPYEPSWLTSLLIFFATILVATQTGQKDARALVAWGIVLIGLGFSIATLRAQVVEAPVLSYRYYGPVEGRLVSIDRSSRDALRMTLDQVRLSRVPSHKTPERVRISVAQIAELPVIGSKVATTAHLMPPQGPSEPGGFDYRRYAWFMQLGANGYTRNPVLVLQPPTSDLLQQRSRYRLSGFIQDSLAGETGALAAAIITGDRSAIGQDVLRVLRASNLAHLLAISGLHMGLLTGFIFAAFRFGLCLCPPLALRCDVKKIAAVTALIGATAYLGVSGGNVATERAYVMVCVVLGAVLLNRRAFSLRAVAVAATLVLLRRPETLLSPGFQMSFAATTALIAVFGFLRDHQIPLGPSWLKPVVAVLISSSVAGFATAPFAAAHFNILSHYGLIANIAAVPVMGAIVVPSAVLALCLTPFGLEQFGLVFLEAGLKWILLVANWVSDLPHALRAVSSPGIWVLPIMTLGGLTIVLWQGRIRWLGFAPLVVALIIWATDHRPVALISDNGGLVGVMGAEGRALSRESGESYAARSWLRRDGDAAKQPDAAARWPNDGNNTAIRRSYVAGHRLAHVIGKRAARLKISCQDFDLVITSIALDLKGQCLVLQPNLLRRTGSVRIEADGSLVTAAELAGDRLWTTPHALTVSQRAALRTATGSSSGG